MYLLRSHSDCFQPFIKLRQYSAARPLFCIANQVPFVNGYVRTNRVAWLIKIKIVGVKIHLMNSNYLINLQFFIHFWSFLREAHFGNAVDTFIVMLVDDAINHAIHPILKYKQTADKKCKQNEFSKELFWHPIKFAQDQ